jgi:undecaprenyl-diphosphatase
MMTGKARMILIVVCLVVYLSLCLLLVGHKLKGLDLQITVASQKIANEPLDWVFSWFTLLGNIEFTTLVIFFFCWWLWRRGQTRAALALFFLFVFGNVVELAFKQRLEARPPELTFYRGVFGLTLVSVKTRYAFPSGHIWRTTFLALVLGALLRARLARFSWHIPFVLTLFVLVMAFSRIYIGDHWFSDVLGGMALAGMVFAFVDDRGFAVRRLGS